MPQDKSVQMVAKAGDVTSIDAVSKRAEGAIDRPPAEALLSAEHRQAYDGMSATQEVKSMLKQMVRSPSSRRVFLLAGAALTILLLKVVGEIRMNQWNGAFFRAVEQKNLHDVWHQSQVFVAIVAVMLSFVVSMNWCVERFKIRLREWLVGNLLDSWMKPGLAYRLNMTSEETLNPDQRIHEDAVNFSIMSTDLGLGIITSSLMLFSFIGVLWGLSRGIAMPWFGGKLYTIPGYMVWFALFYAGLGSWLAARVGRPLITLNEERYTREANFRYSLVRVSDNAESIAFYAGEQDERKIVDSALAKVLGIARTLSFANARLTWIAVGHGWMVVILPVLVALPGYLQGKLDFGGLMMVVGAFNQVQQSLRWFVENFGRIADWRASLHRVVSFRYALETVDEPLDETVPGEAEQEKRADRIELVPSENGNLIFDGTAVTLMGGKVVISDATAEIGPGERVLLSGESGSGKSTLLRAVGGLWPWGGGTIKLPPKDQMMFLPQRPYIPLGTLAQAIAYPRGDQKWDVEKMKECLIRVNLEAFIPMLDESARWDKMMSLGQQQRLAFARLLLHRPKWVFLDEATSALDDGNQDRMMRLFMEELEGTSLLSVGHRQGLEEYHTRTLHLNQTVSGRVLSRKPKPVAQRSSNSLLRKIGEVFRRSPELTESSHDNPSGPVA